ncbi:MAG: hypothetical protein JNK78_03630, partial [Planctomycetes bacterium]|nr:hypothetical protein [Planctomycetota bacterium]
MHHVHRPLPAFLLTTAALTAALAAQGTPIGFQETYALASDRAKVVATLIPGTDEFYYWHCRERLDARDFTTVRDVLPAWTRAHGRNDRVVEIENRAALLSFADDPSATWAFVRDRLGLRFNQQRVVPGERSDLPTRLDPARLSQEVLTQHAFARSPGTVDGFTDRALWSLARTSLDDDRLRSLLRRLDRPDVDDLPALIVRDLQNRQTGAFGSMPVHSMLRRAQLDECARLMPQLLQQRGFVDVYLARLQPGGDTLWQLDADTRGAQLARLWEFAQRLPSSHNSLKAHVLFHWLAHDLTQGAPDRDRFLAYIRLPRRTGHPSEQHLRQFGRAQEHVDGRTNYPTGFPAIGDDEPLVRACLEHFFAREAGYEQFAEFLDADWLKAVFAETKMLAGEGDMQRWYAMLGDPSAVDRIEQRIEIRFPATMRTQFGADEPVALEVDTKNVPTLLVKVFAIDSYRYLQEKQAEVDATIDLDGVVANFEQTFGYSEPKVRRVRRAFDLPMLKEPGTYVVEFVGNGTSSRAVVHKGWLRHAERAGAAGHVFRVYDEAGSLQKTANLWFGGREYGADANGEIVLPFTTEPGVHKVVLRSGPRASLVTFAHVAETYSLAAPAHVERESLVAGRKARVLIRPDLRLGDASAPLQLLVEPVLRVVATDIDGQQTTQEVRDAKIVDEREIAHEITVPERLASLQISLHGRVKDLAGKDIDLSSATTVFAVNGIDATSATNAVTLVQAPDGYALEVRGKNGETRGGVVCGLRFTHRDFRESADASLQTDAAGRISLGALPGITRIDVQLPNGFYGGFTPPVAKCSLPNALHGIAGAALRIPYQGSATEPMRSEFSLLGSERDEFSHLAIADGFLELRGLEPGDYELRVHETGQRLAVRITKGARDGHFLVGTDRILSTSPDRPLQVRAVQAEGDELVVRLANATDATRVHVVATRFVSPFDTFADLFAPRARDTVTPSDRAGSSYHSGRQLGDEYRYVLERRFAVKFPGNMLGRPSLLVNPWALDQRSTNEAVGTGGGAGGRFGGRGGANKPGDRPGAARDFEAGGTGAAGAHVNLDWMPESAPLLANLVPGADGTVRVKLADLGTGHVVQVLAIDGDQAVEGRLVRTEASVQPRARQLQAALDGTMHFTEQKRIEFVAAGGDAVLADARSAQVEIYDSLAAVHRLLSTISRDESLSRFAFVLAWPTFDAAKKREMYSQNACHELAFFLSRKDPEFFAAVVKPLLANKIDKTFLDHWLLEDDLREFLDPWRFAQLNLIERILLAQRLGGDERTAVARTIREAVELRPPSVERTDVLFGLALRGNELADQDKNVVGGLLKAPAAPAPSLAPGAPSTAGPGGPPPKEAEEKRAAAKDEAGAPPPTDALTAVSAERQQDRGESLERRRQVRRLFRMVEPTRLLVEHAYWHRRLEQMTPDAVAPNRFWLDYATAPAGQPFAPSSVMEATGSALEMLMALAVLDLPFEAGKHEVTVDGDRRTLRAATPLLLVRKETTKTDAVADGAPLLLGENFFRLDDRFRFVDGERRDAFVTDEFLVDVAYG